MYIHGWVLSYCHGLSIRIIGTVSVWSSDSILCYIALSIVMISSNISIQESNNQIESLCHYHGYESYFMPYEYAPSSQVCLWRRGAQESKPACHGPGSLLAVQGQGLRT